MKKSKCLSIVAAALLTVAPIATTSAAIVGNHVVKAADTNDATKITFSLKKPTLTLKAGYGWNNENVAKNIVASTGKVSLDSADINIDTYKKGADGEIEWGNPVDPYDLKNGDEGIIVVSFNMKGLKYKAPYTFQSKTDDSGDLVWVDTVGDWDGNLYDPQPAVKIPFVVGSKKSSNSNKVVDPEANYADTSDEDTNDDYNDYDDYEDYDDEPVETKTVKKVKKTKRVRRSHKRTVRRYLRGRITGRRNRRVRTYTSRGRFTHHYVRGCHSYKFNARKVIKGKVYYKIYGKRQYVRASYIKF